MSGSKWWKRGPVALALVAGGWTAACGNTERRPRVDDGAVGDAGEPGNRGGSGASTGGGGTGGTSPGGDAGGTGGVSALGGGGGQPITDPDEELPLIVGDGACPPSAPSQWMCDVEASCVYPGIRIPRPRLGEARCDCVDQQWLCVITDQRFEPDCPLVHWDRLRVEAAPCPPDPERVCFYWIAGNSYGVACGCNFLVDSVPPDWTCAL